MLAAYLLALREGLEAALILGILLGALRKLNRRDLAPQIWLGAGSAALVALIAAFALYRLGVELEGRPEEIFEGITMLLAAGVLTWMVFWMSTHAPRLRQELEAEVHEAAQGTVRWGLFGVAFLAVVREGLELALFLTATTFASGLSDTLWGSLLGLGTAALLGWSLFASLINLDLRRFFQVTTVLLLLFAAGLVAHGVHEFNEAGWIPAIIEHVWDLNAVLPEKSFLGQVLTALFGYNANPSLTEVLAYLAYLLPIGIHLRRQFLPAPQAA